MFTHSIRWRLQLWLAFLLLCVLSGFGVAVYQLQRANQPAANPRCADAAYHIKAPGFGSVFSGIALNQRNTITNAKFSGAFAGSSEKHFADVHADTLDAPPV